MKNLTPELTSKLKNVKSAGEFLELAKENGVELTETEAKTYFAQLVANGAVADDEITVVTGGFNCGNENDSEANTTDSNLDMNISNEKSNSKFV
jgi:hypothetical protein